MPSILTPSGYRDIADCQAGDDVVAFDAVTGEPIINHIELIQPVDLTEWQRWWSVAPTVPAFQFYKINDTWTLNSEQSIWRNGTEVCHAKHLVVGDVIYDDADHDVTITSIEAVEADSWTRFDISGDHSYIVDGLTLHNASRFWVVTGNGNMDGVTTTHIASTTGGAGGASYPGSADTLTFDGNSFTSVVTPTVDHTLVSLSFTSTYAGTFAGNTNNNSFTLSTGFVASTSGLATISLGNGTWSLTASSGTPWSYSASSSTFNCNSSTIAFQTKSNNNTRTFAGGGKTYSTVTFGANTGFATSAITGANTFSTLSFDPPQDISIQGSLTQTITTLSLAGSQASPILLRSNGGGSIATLSVASNAPTMTWLYIRDITATGGASFVATNSFDISDNTGITIRRPLVARASYALGI